MSELEELACQKILNPAMAWTPSAAELVELDRINERNEKIRKARSDVSRGRYIPLCPPTLSSRPSGVPAVFHRDDSKAAATDYDDDEYTPSNQQFSSSQAMTMDAHVRITLEQRVQETTITDSNVDDMLASECDNFLSEINEQHAIASSLRDKNDMRTDSNINDVMASSVTDASASKTTTATADDSVLFMQLRSNVVAYKGLSHLHPTVIMETRRETLFNRRRRVHLKEVAAAPFRPISTLKMHLPNDLHPIRRTPLAEEAIVEFDALSRGLANEALRREPKNCDYQSDVETSFSLYHLLIHTLMHARTV